MVHLAQHYYIVHSFACTQFNSKAAMHCSKARAMSWGSYILIPIWALHCCVKSTKPKYCCAQMCNVSYQAKERKCRKPFDQSCSQNYTCRLFIIFVSMLRLRFIVFPFAHWGLVHKSGLGSELEWHWISNKNGHAVLICMPVVHSLWYRSKQCGHACKIVTYFCKVVTILDGFCVWIGIGKAIMLQCLVYRVGGI